MANTTTVIPPSVSYATGSGGTFSSVQTPGELPTLTDQEADAYMSQEIMVPAGGSVVNVPGPYTADDGDRVIQITNVDPTGYVVLSFYSTADGPYAVLAPNGGMFAITSTRVTLSDNDSGNNGPIDGDWLQLRSCSAAGVLADGVATRVRITVLGEEP